jgi:hypothetical protein
LSPRSRFLKSANALTWLGQFQPEDQNSAIELLRALKFVSRDSFFEHLRTLLLSRLSKGKTPVGLYAERELQRRHGVPFRLFKEPRRKIKRATGLGPQPVQSTNLNRPDVGSEGIVAQLISELCRERPNEFFNHPGPNIIRKKKIRRFLVVTDFLGSGKRVRTYLEAAWRVRSVRSWWSARNSVGMSFEVLAYAATASGRQAVESHASTPTVHVASGCPTVDNTFGHGAQPQILQLCANYNPARLFPALGYESVGSLIVFAHGIPNNAPAILHKKSDDWAPLFPVRMTSETRADLAEEFSHPVVAERLMRMRQKRLALSPQVKALPVWSQSMILILGALGNPPRHDEILSRRTGLTILEVQTFIAKARANGWIGMSRHLTDRGHLQLQHARKSGQTNTPIQTKKKEFYFPSSLRAPIEISS